MTTGTTNPTGTEPRPPRVTLVVTVHDRFHELTANLRASHALFGALGCRPRVLLVWGNPVVALRWAVRSLLAGGLVDRVLERAKLPDEGPGRATSHPESVNIQTGLFEAFLECPQPDYALLQAADARPTRRGYEFVAKAMREGHRACAFYWPNPSAPFALHTNFLAVGPDPAVWPPFSPPGYGDCLEWHWGKLLTGVPGVMRCANAGCCMFAHEHLSEALPPFERRNELAGGGVPLFLGGRHTLRTRWRAFCAWLRRRPWPPPR